MTCNNPTVEFVLDSIPSNWTEIPLSSFQTSTGTISQSQEWIYTQDTRMRTIANIDNYQNVKNILLKFKIIGPSDIVEPDNDGITRSGPSPYIRSNGECNNYTASWKQDSRYNDSTTIMGGDIKYNPNPQSPDCPGEGYEEFSGIQWAEIDKTISDGLEHQLQIDVIELEPYRFKVYGDTIQYLDMNDPRHRFTSGYPGLRNDNVKIMFRLFVKYQ